MYIGGCYVLFWINTRSSNPQNNTFAATYLQYTNHPPPKKTNKTWLHCYVSRDKLISNVLLWIHTQRHTSRYKDFYQLCMDTECCLENRPKAILDSDEWRERERESQGNSCYQHNSVIMITHTHTHTHTHIHVYIYLYIVQNASCKSANKDWIFFFQN